MKSYLQKMGQSSKSQWLLLFQKTSNEPITNDEKACQYWPKAFSRGEKTKKGKMPKKKA